MNRAVALTGAQRDGASFEPRCLHCGYLLVGLTAARCPECGTTFDPTDWRTFSQRPMRLRWKFWVPGLLLGGVGGGLILGLLVWAGSFGWGLTLALPFSIGSVLGYGVRVPKILSALIVTLLVLGFAFGLVGWGLAGLLCAVVLAGVLFGPIIIGTVSGVVLRLALRRTHFGRSVCLPVALFLLPAGVTALEARHPQRPQTERIRTSRVLAVPDHQAWARLMFYEEVRHDPPWLCRIGLPRPLYTRGRISQSGDVKVCVYDKGRLVKMISEYQPPQRLGFRVNEQRGIEDRSVRLLAGSFEFESLGPHKTRVTLTTEYEALLSARPIWRPFEVALARALHGHVLEGMMDQAAPQPWLALAAGAP